MKDKKIKSRTKAEIIANAKKNQFNTFTVKDCIELSQINKVSKLHKLA